MGIGWRRRYGESSEGSSSNWECWRDEGRPERLGGGPELVGRSVVFFTYFDEAAERGLGVLLLSRPPSPSESMARGAVFLTFLCLLEGATWVVLPLLEDSSRDLFFVARAGALVGTSEGDGARVGSSADEVASIAVSVTVRVGGGKSKAELVVGGAEFRSAASL